MKIYIAGITGTGMGPLALMAAQAGVKVYGSDLQEGAVSEELKKSGIEYQIGEQNGDFLQRVHEEVGLDWFVYTSSLPENHPELSLAKKLGLRISKRDELIANLVESLNLKMVAIAGTHGKTTVTAMIVWSCKQLGIPVSYLVGSTLSFGEAGHYEPASKFFIYEADEYDRNFLQFRPWLAVISSVSYDHPDIYKTVQDYQAAFEQFEEQSEQTIRNVAIEQAITLTGLARRYDATLALMAVEKIVAVSGLTLGREEIIAVLNKFPGVKRRFEQITEGVFTDYAHHPEEISATVELALEEARQLKKSGVVVVYEPHQNVRQHELRDGYREAFIGVNKLFWLPTFLTREDPNLVVFEPADFINSLRNASVGESAEINDELAERLKEARKNNYLIVLMSAGPADAWLRKIFGEIER